MQAIQTAMTQRAVELLNLPQDKPLFLLDVGCGTGMSGEELTMMGYHWVGCDISPHMLGMAAHVKRPQPPAYRCREDLPVSLGSSGSPDSDSRVQFAGQALDREVEGDLLWHDMGQGTVLLWAACTRQRLPSPHSVRGASEARHVLCRPGFPARDL
jgi:SAM-dependent methyltransferase